MTTTMYGYDDSHMRALGRATAAAGRLEVVVARIVEDLISPDQAVAQAVISGMTFERRLDLIEKLATIKRPITEDNPWPKFTEWKARCKAAMIQRNRLLHGDWTFAPDPDGTVSAQVRSVSRKGQTVRDTYRDGQLDQVAADLGRLGSDGALLYLETLPWSGSFIVDEDGAPTRVTPPHRQERSDSGS